jgi:hypothetical protein
VTHPDEPALVAYVTNHASAVALGVYDSEDPDAARAALVAASHEIGMIRHPEEPQDSMVSWCAVLDDNGAPVLHVDMKDQIEYSALIVRIALDALGDAGVGGRLEPKRHPRPPFEDDGNARMFTGLKDLAELTGRGLPPGFPEDFPVPDDVTLVLAEHGTEDAVEHVAWRAGAPFTGYLRRLVEYGLVFGEVPRLLTLNSGVPRIARYTVYRDGSGGSVLFYESAAEQHYVSVVWHPDAAPPPAPVTPSVEPDRREVARGPQAGHEIAAFLAPPGLVCGYETVIAFATAARTLQDMTRGVPGPADLAARLTTIMGRVDRACLKTVRHVCLTMVRNVLDSGRRGRPAGLTLEPDEDGLLFAADLRSQLTGSMPETEMHVVETGVALMQGAPMAAEILTRIRSTPVRQPADRYQWLFAGLSVEQFDEARAACWKILGA